MKYNESWVLPGDGFVGEGYLKLDYCSLTRVDKKTSPATPERIIDQLLELMNGPADDPNAAQAARFCALKDVSHKIVVSARQVHEFCKAFPYEKQRLDTFVTLFSRCTEIGTPLIDGKGGVLADSEIWSHGARHELKDRLGMPHLLDIHNMHGAGHNRHTFDLSVRDERLCASFMIKVAEVEPGLNMTDCEYSLWRNRGFEVPKTWLDSIPCNGVLEMTYQCKNPSDYLPEIRSAEAKTRFGWHITTPF